MFGVLTMFGATVFTTRMTSSQSLIYTMDTRWQVVPFIEHHYYNHRMNVQHDE